MVEDLVPHAIVRVRGKKTDLEAFSIWQKFESRDIVSERTRLLMLRATMARANVRKTPDRRAVTEHLVHAGRRMKPKIGRHPLNPNVIILS